MSETKLRQVRVKKTSLNAGGRPRSDLKDVNKDETYQKVPNITTVESMLINDVARNLFQETSRILVHRQQLKPAHITLLITYCNAFAVTAMTRDELVSHELATLNDGKLQPPRHVIYAAYAGSMFRAMQLLRLDPKTELMNCLAKATEKKGSQYIDASKDLYDEM